MVEWYWILISICFGALIGLFVTALITANPRAEMEEKILVQKTEIEKLKNKIELLELKQRGTTNAKNKKRS